MSIIVGVSWSGVRNRRGMPVVPCISVLCQFQHVGHTGLSVYDVTKR